MPTAVPKEPSDRRAGDRRQSTEADYRGEDRRRLDRRSEQAGK